MTTLEGKESGTINHVFTDDVIPEEVQGDGWIAFPVGVYVPQLYATFDTDVAENPGYDEWWLNLIYATNISEATIDGYDHPGVDPSDVSVEFTVTQEKFVGLGVAPELPAGALVPVMGLIGFGAWLIRLKGRSSR